MSDHEDYNYNYSLMKLCFLVVVKASGGSKGGLRVLEHSL